jgi:glycosyltransferase involved in cell wall biosynthesis
MRICAVLPAFNEASAVGRVVSGIRPHVHTVLVVDDGSNDGTSVEAHAAGALVVRHATNEGKGRALRTALTWVLARPFTHALLMDADGQHAADDAPALIAAGTHPDVDLVIGERVFSRDAMPAARYYSNVVGSWALSKFVGVPVADTQSGFRLVRCAALRGVELTARGYEIETEMLIRLMRRRARLKCVPVQAVYGVGLSKLRPVRDTTRTCFLAVKYRFLSRERVA